MGDRERLSLRRAECELYESTLGNLAGMALRKEQWGLRHFMERQGICRKTLGWCWPVVLF